MAHGAEVPQSPIPQTQGHRTIMEYDSYAFKRPRKKRVSKITGRATALSPELEFQISLVVYYDKRCRLDRKLRESTRLYAVNPLPGKTQRVAELSKAAGLRAGVFDLCLFKKNTLLTSWKGNLGFKQIWLECKAGKGTYTDAQKGWMEWLRDTPIQCHEVRTLDEFIQILEG